MRKKFIIALFFAIVLGAVGFLLRPVFADTIDQLQSQIEQLEQETAKLEKEAQKYREIIYEKKSKIQTLKQAIGSLQAQEAKLRIDIKTTQHKIEAKNLEIKRLGLEIAKKEADIKKSKKLLANLLKSLNRRDQITTIEVVFSFDNFSDLVRVIKDLSLIQNNLNKHLGLLKERQSELIAASNKRKQERERLNQLKDQKQAQKFALAQTRSKKEGLLAKQKRAKSHYQSLLEKTIAQKKELFEKIRVMEREVERRKNFLVFVESETPPEPGTKLFLWPEQGAILTQGYGMTSFANQGHYGGGGHYGIDMASGPGSAIRAAASGKVIAKGFNSGWGNWVALEHKGGVVTLYGHMLKPSPLHKEAEVEAGQVIGYEGSTGFSTGPHLHFGVYLKFYTFLRSGHKWPCYFPSDSCQPINPLDYL